MEIDGKIDPRQYAHKGHSTRDALLYILQPIYEATDSGNAGACLFFTDFSKGFDLIDHNILLEVLPSIISCIAGFLAGPNQAVISLKGGVTKHRNGMERAGIYWNEAE